jgi:GNAT superfamily N-acetyltransferase/predicted GNAT family acetyltransferase
MENIEIVKLAAPVDPVFEEMTFPVYRHLLLLEPTPRHPEQGDDKQIQPLGLAALRAGSPLGLLLAETPLGDEGVPEVLSLYCKPEARNQGLGTALVSRIEDVLREMGFSHVSTVYMTGKPTIAAVERILDKRGWTAPAVRTVTLRFTPDEALSTRWFGRVRLSGDYEIFSWTELTATERDELQRSQAESKWIPEGLEPWRHDAHSFDPLSSVGLRYKGQVVGWVINHRVGTDTVRFTCSFVRKDLGRRGRILPLYTESIRRLRTAGCKTCTFITPVEYETMVDFARQRCAPWASYFGETCGSTKALLAPSRTQESSW